MAGLRITPNVACRTLVSDIAPTVDVVQASGAPVEVCAFIGSSSIRQYAEDWTLERMHEVGERIWNLERQFNLAAGFTRADDCLPLRTTTEPAVGGAAGAVVASLNHDHLRLARAAFARRTEYLEPDPQETTA